MHQILKFCNLCINCYLLKLLLAFVIHKNPPFPIMIIHPLPVGQIPRAVHSQFPVSVPSTTLTPYADAAAAICTARKRCFDLATVRACVHIVRLFAPSLGLGSFARLPARNRWHHWVLARDEFGSCRLYVHVVGQWMRLLGVGHPVLATITEMAENLVGGSNQRVRPRYSSCSTAPTSCADGLG